MMIDPETLQLATPACPVTREEVFVRGTEPTEFCARHGGRTMAGAPGASWLSRIFGGGKPAPAEAPAQPAAAAERKAPAIAPRQTVKTDPGKQPAAEGEKKKRLFKRIFGIFGGGKKEQDQPPPKP